VEVVRLALVAAAAVVAPAPAQLAEQLQPIATIHRQHIANVQLVTPNILLIIMEAAPPEGLIILEAGEEGWMISITESTQ